MRGYFLSLDGLNREEQEMVARRCTQYVRAWLHFSGKEESSGTINVFSDPVDMTQVLELFINTPKDLKLKGEHQS
jgi:hypothetical protein